jgi:hypothetical protein
MSLDNTTVASAIEDHWSAAFIKARAVEEDGAKLFNDIDEDMGITVINIHSINLKLSDDSERVAIELTDDVNANKRSMEEMRDEIDREGGFRQPKRLAYFFKRRRCTDRLMPYDV